MLNKISRGGKLVNDTPHPINLYGIRGIEMGPYLTIPPSGNIVRVGANDLGYYDMLVEGGEVVKVAYEEYGHYLTNLPPEEDGVFHIVSLPCIFAANLKMTRGDLLAPFEEIRSGDGTIIGCKFLQKVV